MIWRTFIPYCGTASLALIASVLGYLAINDAADLSIEVKQPTLDVVVQPAPFGNTGRVVPAARPEIYYAAITERPLFATSRRPSEKVSDIAPAVVEPEARIVDTPRTVEPPVIALLGILGSGTNRSALIAHGDNEADWLRVDAAVDDWTITEIGQAWIILSDGENTFRLELFE